MSDQSWTLLVGLILLLLVSIVIERLIMGGVRLATTKVCPACKERVKSDATKCRYCGTAIGEVG